MPATDKPLRFAINLGNAVLAKTLPNGEPGGITVELAQRIANHMGLQPSFVTYPAAGLVVDDAGRDKWDIAFLAIDPKREEVLRFTQPYIVIQGTMLVNEGSEWQSVADVDREGVVINVGKGAAYDLHLTRHLKHARLNRLASSQAAIEAFLNGEGDMAAGIRQPLEKTASVNPRYRVLPDNFGQIQQAICVPYAHESMHECLSSLLNEWLADHSLQTLVDHQLATQ